MIEIDKIMERLVKDIFIPSIDGTAIEETREILTEELTPILEACEEMAGALKYLDTAIMPQERRYDGLTKTTTLHELTLLDWDKRIKEALQNYRKLTGKE